MLFFFLFSDSLEKRRRRDRHQHRDYQYFRPEQEIFPPDQIQGSCDGANTIRILSGECKCAQGFPFGDPSGIQGCWNCEDDCNDDAKCIYPGICQCIPGFKGNGVRECEPITPKLLSFYPKSGKAGTNINISYSMLNNSNPLNAYCKFGSIPIDAKFVTSNYIICEVPKMKSEDALLTISLDAMAWSTEEFYFKVKGESDPIRLFPFILGSIVIVGTILYALNKVAGDTRKKKYDDHVPFLKLGSKKNDGISPFELFKKKGKLLI